MDDPVAVALKRRAQTARLLGLRAPRRVGLGGERRELLRLQRADPSLERRGDVSLRERVIQVCRVRFHRAIVARDTAQAGLT